jgi:hypothetical protein
MRGTLFGGRRLYCRRGNGGGELSELIAISLAGMQFSFDAVEAPLDAIGGDRQRQAAGRKAEGACQACDLG